MPTDEGDRISRWAPTRDNYYTAAVDPGHRVPPNQVLLPAGLGKEDGRSLAVDGNVAGPLQIVQLDFTNKTQETCVVNPRDWSNEAVKAAMSRAGNDVFSVFKQLSNGVAASGTSIPVANHVGAPPTQPIVPAYAQPPANPLRPYDYVVPQSTPDGSQTFNPPAQVTPVPQEQPMFQPQPQPSWVPTQAPLPAPAPTQNDMFLAQMQKQGELLAVLTQALIARPNQTAPLPPPPPPSPPPALTVPVIQAPPQYSTQAYVPPTLAPAEVAPVPVPPSPVPVAPPVVHAAPLPPPPDSNYHKIAYLNPVPAKPSIHVLFRMPRLGTMAAYYHGIEIGSGCLLLTYDRRYADGIQYVPAFDPEINQEGLVMSLIVPGETAKQDKTYSVRYFGLSASIGTLDILIFLLDNEPIEPQAQA